MSDGATHFCADWSRRSRRHAGVEGVAALQHVRAVIGRIRMQSHRLRRPRRRLVGSEAVFMSLWRRVRLIAGVTGLRRRSRRDGVL